MCDVSIKFVYFIIIQLTGEFGSPVQDGSYPKNIECHYLIKLPKDSKMTLTFLTFNMEDSHSCNFDYVEVRT